MKRKCYYMAFRMPVVAESEAQARDIIAELCLEGDACNDIGDSDPFVTTTERLVYSDGKTYPLKPDWFVESVSDDPDEIEAHRRGDPE